MFGGLAWPTAHARGSSAPLTQSVILALDSINLRRNSTRRLMSRVQWLCVLVPRLMIEFGLMGSIGLVYARALTGANGSHQPPPERRSDVVVCQ